MHNKTSTNSNERGWCWFPSALGDTVKYFKRREFRGLSFQEALSLRQQGTIYSFVCGFALGERKNRTRRRWKTKAPELVEGLPKARTTSQYPTT